MLLVFGAPCQLRSLAGQEHGRTIPLAALLHKRRRAFPIRLSPKEAWWNLHDTERINGLRMPMVARHQRDWLVVVAAAIEAFVCHAPFVRNPRIGWTISAERNSDPVETPIGLKCHYEQREAIQGECYANPSS